MSTDEPDAEDLAEAFPHVAKLEQQLKEADIDVGDIPQRKGTTRRDLLAGSAGLLGLGGILTGASGTAQAGDDQAGQFGTQAAPQDGYVEDLYDKNGNRVAELPGDGSLDVLQDVSAESVSTGGLSSKLNNGQYQSAIDGLVVPFADGVGVVDAVNPSSTTTPLQDSIDAIDAAADGGVVHLPAGVVQFSSALDFKGNQIVFDGLGNTPQTEEEGISTIEFAGSGSTSNHAVEVDGTDDGSGFRNVTIKGPGSGSTVGNAIRFTGNPEGFRLSNVTFSAWGSEPVIESVDKPFDMNWGKVEYHDIGGGFMLLNDLGPNNRIDMLRTRGGEYILDQRNGSIQIDTINSGGDPGAGGPSDEMIRTHGGLEFDYWNFEPSGTFDGTTLLYHKFSNTPTRLGRVINRGTTDYILEVDTVGNATYGPFYNSGTVNTSIASAKADVVSPVGYDGPTSDWDSSGFGARIHCLDGDIT